MWRVSSSVNCLLETASIIQFELSSKGCVGSLQILGAWAVEGVEAKIGPSDGQVFDDFAAEYLDIWQESGEK